MRRCVLAVVSLLKVLVVTAQTCPPKGFSSKSDLIPTNFFQGTWFCLQVGGGDILSAESHHCLSSQIIPSGAGDEFSFQLSNGANDQGVTGKRSTVQLTGAVPDASLPGQAIIGAHKDPYWVIDAGSYYELPMDQAIFKSTDYEWAIVSGGLPVVASAGGCLPKAGTDVKGLWILSRTPTVSQEMSHRISAIASAKGLDTSTLLAVQQNGCRH